MYKWKYESLIPVNISSFVCVPCFEPGSYFRWGMWDCLFYLYILCLSFWFIGWKKSCIYSQVGIAAVAVNENWSLVLPPPAGLVGLILIFLQSCNMPANEPQNRSRTTWGLETVGPILAVAHHQLHLLLLYITLCYSQQHSLKSVMGRSKCQSHNCHYFPTCNY